MITSLTCNLVDFNGAVLMDGPDVPWTVRSAILTALVHPEQPKELVDKSIQIVEVIERATGDETLLLPPEFEDHILLCCKMALHPLLYHRVRGCFEPDTQPEANGEALKCQ